MWISPSPSKRSRGRCEDGATLRKIGAVGTRVAAVALGVAFFLVVVVGGGVYRNDCATRTGPREKGWELGGTFPYLQGPHAGCENHSLTRYVLGKVGVMSDVEPTFNATLVRQVGASSLELAAVVPALHAATHYPGSFNEPTLEGLVLDLLKGQLNKLSAHDIVLLAEANRNTVTHMESDLTTVKRLDTGLAAARINPGAYHKLTSDEQTFIADWDAYVASATAVLQLARSAILAYAPTVNEFQALLKAATQYSRSTASFANVRSHYLTSVARISTELQRQKKAIAAATTPPEQTFAALVRKNTTARAIVEAVNAQYPHGVLAQEFKGL